MAKRFINTPDPTGQAFETSHYNKLLATREDGAQVYKRRRKVLLVKKGVTIDLFEWDVYGDDYRQTQHQAMYTWGVKWHIS